MLLTDWVRIGLSGATVDGRKIKASWLKEAADSYSLDLYTASINREHTTWYGNLGQIQQLKTEEENGKTALYAKFRPDADLVHMNKMGNALFTSMEIKPKFADTGKAYLTGLAVTDDPASLGTQQLNFSNVDEPIIFISEGLQIETFVEESAGQEPESKSDDDEPETQLSIFKRLAKTLNFKVIEKEQAPTAYNSDSDAVKIFKELKTLIQSSTPDLSNLFNREKGEALTEQYAALKEDYDQTAAEVHELTERFTHALKETPTADPKDHTASNPDKPRIL